MPRKKKEKELDVGKWLRKMIWIKPTADDVEILVRNYVYMTTYWTPNIQDEVNIEAWVQPNEPLPSEAAARELGFTWNYPYNDFNNLVTQYLWTWVITKYKDALKEDRKDYMENLADGVIEQTLTGDLAVSDEKRVDTALKFKQIANQKIEVNHTNTINMSFEEAMSQLNELTLWMDPNSSNLILEADFDKDDTTTN